MSILKKNILNAAEIFRTVAELAQFVRERSELLNEAQRGDGHPVLVIPGFTEPDSGTKPMRGLLTELGYKTYGWGGGFNLGLREKKCLHLRRRLKEIYEENGRQKVTLIGLSLGGIVARELAREFPEMVRDTISVHSPFGIGLHKGAVPFWLSGAVDILSDSEYSLKSEGMAERLITPPPVPTTSIYSKSDPLANWQACLNPKAPQAENIEVNGSHSGGLFHPDSIAVILGRLAQPEGKWKPYKKKEVHSSKEPTTDWKNQTAGRHRFFPK